MGRREVDVTHRVAFYKRDKDLFSIGRYVLVTTGNAFSGELFEVVTGSSDRSAGAGLIFHAMIKQETASRLLTQAAEL
jgi:hypothetical protein